MNLTVAKFYMILLLMKTQLVSQKKKKMEKLSSLAIKNQENKDFNKPLGRHVFCFFDKYMIIRMNYMSSNNFPVM